jgi:hypothetical protein
MGAASGENWTMPNGTDAPGKTFPPFAVPIKGLTSLTLSVPGVWARPKGKVAVRRAIAANERQSSEELAIPNRVSEVLVVDCRIEIGRFELPATFSDE